MSSRDPIPTFTPGQCLAKEMELKQAEKRLAELDAAFDRDPHKAGSHEHNMQYRRWSDQRQKVKEMRETLDLMRKFERS